MCFSLNRIQYYFLIKTSDDTSFAHGTMTYMELSRDTTHVHYILYSSVLVEKDSTLHFSLNVAGDFGPGRFHMSGRSGDVSGSKVELMRMVMVMLLLLVLLLLMVRLVIELRGFSAQTAIMRISGADLTQEYSFESSSKVSIKNGVNDRIYGGREPSQPEKSCHQVRRDVLFRFSGWHESQCDVEREKRCPAKNERKKH